MYVIVAFLLVILGLIPLIWNFVKRVSVENFETRESILEGVEYLNCIALDHVDPKEESEKYTGDVLKRAPCWSYFSEKSDIEAVFLDVLESCKKIAEKNDNKLKGPVYFVVARNKDTETVNAWVYMPSLDKNGNKITTLQDYYSYHNWVRKLLFTDTFGTKHWLCNNPCDNDLKFSTLYNQEDINPIFQPACGCVSKDACKFYYIPKDVSIKPRDIKKVSSYSVYRLNEKAFSSHGIILDAPTQIEKDHFNDGSTMYVGCDNRLVSKNGKYSFEVLPDGFALYEATSGNLFDDSCSTLPNELNSDQKKEIRKYEVKGTMPRMVNENGDISVFSIIDNSTEKSDQKLLVKEWTVRLSGNSPHTLMLDDTGALKIIDSQGAISDAVFLEL